jgi:hypothetical protein
LSLTGERRPDDRFVLKGDHWLEEDGLDILVAVASVLIVILIAAVF